jgi:hypothetical protein
MHGLLTCTPPQFVIPEMVDTVLKMMAMLDVDVSRRNSSITPVDDVSCQTTDCNVLIVRTHLNIFCMCQAHWVDEAALFAAATFMMRAAIYDTDYATMATVSVSLLAGLCAAQNVYTNLICLMVVACGEFSPE